MKNKTAWLLALAGVLLAALCAVVILTQGKTYTTQMSLYGVDAGATAEEFSADFDTENVAEVTGIRLEDGKLLVDLRSVGPGNAIYTINGPDGFSNSRVLYVHKSGVITEGNYFGDSRGSRVIPIATTLFLALCLFVLLRAYRADTNRNLYQYKNVRNLGLIIFTAFLFLSSAVRIFTYHGLIDTVSGALNSAGIFARVALPIAFVVSVLVTISNVELLRKEGRTWRNILGTILGLLLLVGTVAPFLLGEILQRTTVVDVHNEGGLAMYVEMAVEDGVLVIVTYLECILLATVLLGFRAARRIPAFDKDYIMILGCKMLKDGRPTRLLGSRVERAVEFAKMQKDATGKDLIFVPSGGQGSDEPLSEAECMKNYLMELGIPEEQILPETESENTFQNFGKSIVLMREHAGKDDPKIAFSTTNYHVFRSGMYATKQGIPVEGIGAPTKRYYWVNAFIREFIATLRSEWKLHASICGVWLVITLLMIAVTYLANNL